MTRMNREFKLEDLPKHNVYQVPEHYFDRLPTRVMEQTAGAGKIAPAWQQSLWLLLRATVAPLILLLVFVGVYFYTMQQQKQDVAYAVGPLAEQDIINYLSNHEDLETSDFAELTSLSGQDLTADFINISPSAAEEELEYYHFQDIED